MENKHIRNKTVLFIVCGAFVLFGFGVKTVMLMDDLPLIDLGKAIKEAPFGQNGNPENGNGENPDGKDKDGQEGNGADTGEKQQQTYFVMVRGEAAKFNDKEFTNVKKLDEEIRSKYKKGDKIVIRDDYAEAHFYREVVEQIVKLKESFKIDDSNVIMD